MTDHSWADEKRQTHKQTNAHNSILKFTAKPNRKASTGIDLHLSPFLPPSLCYYLAQRCQPGKDAALSFLHRHTHTHTHTHDTQTHKPIGKYPAKFCSSRMTVVCAEVVGWPSARTSTIWAVIYLRHTFFPFFFSNRCQQSLPLKPWDLMCVCNRGSNQNLFRQQSPQIKTISWRERPKSCQMFSFFLFLLFLVLCDWVRRC